MFSILVAIKIFPVTVSLLVYFAINLCHRLSTVDILIPNTKHVAIAQQVLVSHGMIIQFVDDTYIIVPVTNSDNSRPTSELARIQTWAKFNNLKLNCSKSKNTVFNCTRSAHQANIISSSLHEHLPSQIHSNRDNVVIQQYVTLGF